MNIFKDYMKVTLITITTAIIFLTSCRSDSKKETAGGGSSDTSQLSVENKKPDQGTEAIITSYLELKNALAKDDDKAAAEAGKQLATAFKDFNTSELKEAELKVFEDIREDAIDHASHISTNAGNIGHQREHFETLSEDIYDLKKALGGNQKLYYLHCPMYNKGKGANWVSETKEVQNPYLGKAMPECGTLKEEL